ncbi:MAG: hypothetical protein Q7T74_05255 [Candidatus Saccharibacteria bacterium]|nr:hypothetical protein [Candidatus Saccharibacteria bacterium]
MTKDDIVSFVDNLSDDQTEIVVSISHKDDDHTNYLPYLMEHISHSQSIEKIVIAQTIEEYNPETQDWLNENVHGVETYEADYYSSIEPESSLSCPVDGFASYILTVNSGVEPNDKSMVVLSKLGASQVIFTGDMTGKTEAQIFSNLALLGDSAHFQLADTDLLFGAHHGASTNGSNNKKWADATSPEAVIYSAGERYSHPTCEALDVYQTVLDFGEPHALQCSSTGAYMKFETSNANFLTHTNGLIVATPNNEGGFQISTFDF